MENKRKPFTEEQTEWLISNYRLYGKHHIAEEFNRRFCESRSTDTLWCKVRRLGLTGNGETYRVQRCRDSFGSPLGTEHFNKQGYTLVKVSDIPGGRSKNWRLKQDVVWEKLHGPIPAGHAIMFLDGNKQNFSPENLCCVKNGVLATLSKKNWRSPNPEITKCAVLWAELFSLTGNADGVTEGYYDESLCVYRKQK